MDIQSNAERDAVVAAYKAAGLGGERYGVVCPTCYKRVCLQGLGEAREHPDQFCQHEAEYAMGENIFDVLNTHGLQPRELKPKVRMTEATVQGRPKKKKRKKKARYKPEDDGIKKVPSDFSWLTKRFTSGSK